MSDNPVLTVPQADVDDLRNRLRRTRWGTRWPITGWEAGTDDDELRRLTEVWATTYDWRHHEAAINALPSRFADIDGTNVHYLRFDGERSARNEQPFPIVLTHGWPSSFLELTDLAHRLAAPGQYGGRPEDAFTVIVPSLPGFGLSPQRPTLGAATSAAGRAWLPTHELWHGLMHDELGFRRYAAHGGDLGAGITGRLGQAHPEAVVGIHLLAVADPPHYDPAGLTPDERSFLDDRAQWSTAEGGYEHEQQTRPLTLAPALSDSPAGLLAWLLEKYRAWTGDTMFSDDFVLTQASLYWFTNTISTSFRPYYEHARGLVPRIDRVEVPTAVAVFPHDLVRPPRSWAERAYHVQRYTAMPRGGHFAAKEEPALLAEDLTAFFRDLR
ncbi:epoxide hydrolase family protein [Actinoplanes sp. NPDC051494]|uniref:epoxide hydrolase family protein n=1 Tax=Actinoplanes sp. NPDC051494 TaxID=3363907 RepID=UPI0037BCB420